MNRRRFHIASLLACGGSFAGATSGAPPQRGADRGTFLLVHGAWHSAVHWDAFAAILAGRGCRVLAIPGAAEAIPELIHRLVYLTAYCPVRLPNASGYTTLPEN